MKMYLSLPLCALIVLFSCNGSKKETGSSSDSTAVDSTAVGATLLSGNLMPVWSIVLQKPVTENWGLIIPDNASGVPLFADSKTETVLTSIKDTVQVQILDKKKVTIAPDDACKEISFPNNYNLYKVVAEGKTGWLWAKDFMRPEQLNIGNLKLQGRTVSAVLMSPYYKLDGDYCTPLQSMFLYDNQNLYFIDVTNQDETLHWRNQKHLTFVEPLNMGNISAEPDNARGRMKLNWSVPNAAATAFIGFRDGHFILDSYQVSAQESDVSDLENEGSTDSGNTGEIITEICTFSDFSIGDCGHLEFDCGDFGDALISPELSEEGKQLWQALVVSDDNGERGNPTYVGKKFQIKYKMVKGTICGEPDANGNYYRDGEVAMIIGFRLSE